MIKTYPAKFNKDGEDVYSIARLYGLDNATVVELLKNVVAPAFARNFEDKVSGIEEMIREAVDSRSDVQQQAFILHVVIKFEAILQYGNLIQRMSFIASVAAIITGIMTSEQMLAMIEGQDPTITNPSDVKKN